MGIFDGILPASDPNNPNSQIMTPDDIARRQALAQAMTKQGMDFSPVASPWQGAARMAQALLGAYGSYQAGQDKNVGTGNNQALMAKAMGMDTGDMNIAATPGRTTPALAAADMNQDNMQDGTTPSASPMALAGALSGAPPAQPSAQPSAAPSPAAAPGGTPTMMAAMQPNGPSSGLSGIISQAALSHGVDPNTMMRIGQIESGLKPGAHNPSGASGLFQFMPSTAKQYGLSNPYDPVASADAASQLASDNSKYLANALGRSPTGGEIYLAHQQGAGGAASLLANPYALATSIVGNKAVLQNGGSANMLAGDFAKQWINKVDGGQSGGNASFASMYPAQSAGLPSSMMAGMDGSNPYMFNQPSGGVQMPPDALAMANPPQSQAQAPAQQAITAATGAAPTPTQVPATVDPNDPPVMINGKMWTKASAGATEAADSPEVEDVQNAQNAMKGGAQQASNGAPQQPQQAPQAQQQAPGGIDRQALLQYMADPYTSPQMQQVAATLLQQGTKAGSWSSAGEGHILNNQTGEIKQGYVPNSAETGNTGFIAAGNGAIFDKSTKQFVHDANSPQNDDVKQITAAIINGDQPPDLKGLYGKSAAVRGEMERQGFDFTKANQDYTATTTLLHTMNGAQQTRLRQAVGQVEESLPMVRSLANEWQAGGFPLMNQAQLTLATQGAMGPKAQSIAVRLTAQISDLTSELGTVYKGGNSSTDESLKLAATQLNANWSNKTLLDAVDLVDKNIKYRKNSLRLSTAGIDNSQYNPMKSSDNPIPPGTVAPPFAPSVPIQQGAPQAPAQDAPPVPDAKKAADGKWYLPDPNRPGKYLMVQ